MKLKNCHSTLFLILAFVMLVSCKKSEIQTDYRDKWVGNYPCKLVIDYYSDFPVKKDSVWTWQIGNQIIDSSTSINISKGDSADNLTIWGQNVTINEYGFGTGRVIPIGVNAYYAYQFYIQFYNNDSLQINFSCYVSHFETDFYNYKGKKNN